MKVVINVCYGGFGLSEEAEREYLRLIGKGYFRYRQTKYKYKDGADEFQKITNKDKNFLLDFTFTEDLGDSFSNLEDWENHGYFYSRDIKRNDENLIKVVEMLGEKANGDFAELKIVEIPDGTEWKIEEYDGRECVSEKHETWS